MINATEMLKHGIKTLEIDIKTKGEYTVVRLHGYDNDDKAVAYGFAIKTSQIKEADEGVIIVGN